MTLIVANIFKSGTTTPLTGYVRVLSSAPLSDSVSTFYVTEPVDYPLVAGYTTIELSPSEIAKVSYRFTIYQTAPNEPDVLLYQFDATVPQSLNSINLLTLAGQSGIRHDLRDSSLLTLARYLSQQPTFVDFFLTQVFKASGEWSATVPYTKGSVVTRLGGSYYKQSSGISQNQPPESNPAIWTALATKGATGATGATGAAGVGAGVTTNACVLWEASSGSIPAGWVAMANSPITGDAYFIKKT